MTIDNKDFCIAIIGTGPIGIECGLHARHHGYRFVLFESGNDIAGNIRTWSHVRLFTPFGMNISSFGRAILKHVIDENAFLTGGEYIEQYLRPISHVLESNIRLNQRVTSIGRYLSNKFILLIDNSKSGLEEYFIADIVIDASGTFSCPNFAGPGYLPAMNERAIRAMVPSPITHLIPNIEHEKLAGKRILLLGKGDSAATSVIALAKLKQQFPATELFWIIKQKITGVPFCTYPDNRLPQRNELTNTANQIYEEGKIFTKIYTDSFITKFEIHSSDSQMDITINCSSSIEILPNIDFVISNVGSQPDRSLYANLSVHECYETKGPMALAAKLLATRGEDCLVQVSHGPNSMLTTEKNFFIVGNKSYGKQVNFLLKIGFQQVEDVFQLIQENQKTSQNL